MTNAEQLSASLENYLEAIFNILSAKGGVRAKDIANHLGVKAGSVTAALQGLAKSKHINYQPYEVITLTAKGQLQAKQIVRKHEILKDFFVRVLGADPEHAGDCACKMEHAIGNDLVERLNSFTEFIQTCPYCGSERAKDKMSHQTAETTLLDISKGSKCVVKRIKRRATATKRLVEMGISRGSVIEVERVAPLGDPIEVKVKGYHLSIRKTEAQNIEVDRQ